MDNIDIYNKYRFHPEDYTVKELIDYSIQFSVENPGNGFYIESRRGRFHQKYLLDFKNKYCEINKSYKRIANNRRDSDFVKILYAMVDCKLTLHFIHFPIFKLADYEKWEGGCIEVCAYNNSNQFIRMYSKVTYIEDIIQLFIDYKTNKLSHIF